jgi:glycosyltransferase involved in cell wall biosynthesis
MKKEVSDLNTKAKVSVVIAYHNGSRWIERALESAFSQTLPPFEVIVVNDGSDESESDFLRSLSERLDFTVLEQTNSGQSAARNNGVANATSQLVCLLDQDDHFLPRHIEILLENFDLEDPIFAFSYGDLWRSNESGEIVSHTCVNLGVQHPLRDIKVMLRNNMNILPSATLIRREAFLAVGGFDPELRGYEDDDLFLRFFLSGYRNKFTSEAVTVWTINKSSTSFSESMSTSRFLYLKKLMKTFPAGSVHGTKVFGDLLAPRFGFHLADDVIVSAFRRDENFDARLERLRFFRKLLRSSDEVSSGTRRKFLLTSGPLVWLDSKTLRSFLLVILRIGMMFGTFRIPLLYKFVRKYSSNKEILGK